MPERLKLDAVLDLQATGRLFTQLRRISTAVELDASGVNHVGALAAQLLLSAVTVVRPSAGPVRIIQPSDGFTEGLRRLGISPDRLCA